VNARRWVAVVIGVVVLVGAADLLGVARGGAAGEGEGSPLVGKAAPPLVGPLLAGGRYHLSAGQVTVVNVWASWCAPCRDEVPLIARFADTVKGRGVRVVTVDTRDGIDPAREFLDATHATDLVAVHDPQGRIAVAWGATGVPETFVLDRTGIVRAHRTGEVDQNWLTGEVDRWASR
jgi:cytochrome c biogenesis protein CcmG/thiol:disulfide interchange protein DsbE